jgi:hypothetical protein
MSPYTKSCMPKLQITGHLSWSISGPRRSRWSEVDSRNRIEFREPTTVSANVVGKDPSLTRACHMVAVALHFLLCLRSYLPLPPSPKNHSNCRNSSRYHPLFPNPFTQNRATATIQQTHAVVDISTTAVVPELLAVGQTLCRGISHYRDTPPAYLPRPSSDRASGLLNKN